jgi:hypothetical protein
VNAIIGLGEEIEEYVIVQKLLRSLPMRFNPKISALEERSDLNSIIMDELHGIFTTYEMRIEEENTDVTKASFKASKRSKKKKNKQEEYCNNSDVSEDDEEVANFIKRLNNRTNNRYRGKIPLICFNCDGIGHFSNKCPNKKKRNDEGYSKENTHIKEEEIQRNFSIKSYAPKKTSYHQIKMKSMIVRHEEFNSWQ